MAPKAPPVFDLSRGAEPFVLMQFPAKCQHVSLARAGFSAACEHQTQFRPALVHYDNEDSDTWMAFVVQVVIVIDVVDIKVVVVTPVTRPCFCVFKPIPTVLEALALAALDSSAASRSAVLKVKGMLASEAGTEPVIRNVTSVSARTARRLPIV